MNPGSSTIFLQCLDFIFALYTFFILDKISERYKIIRVIVAGYKGFTLLIQYICSDIMKKPDGVVKTGPGWELDTQVFIIALAQPCKTMLIMPEFSLTDEWRDKIWYLCTVEYCSEINRNEVHATTWEKLEHYANWKMPGHKGICIIPLLDMSRIGDPIDIESRSVVPRSWG